MKTENTKIDHSHCFFGGVTLRQALCVTTERRAAARIGCWRMAMRKG
jgi:hypothetical protein